MTAEAAAAFGSALPEMPYMLPPQDGTAPPAPVPPADISALSGRDGPLQRAHWNAKEIRYVQELLRLNPRYQATIRRVVDEFVRTLDPPLKSVAGVLLPDNRSNEESQRVKHRKNVDVRVRLERPNEQNRFLGMVLPQGIVRPAGHRQR
jgi:hypothetical protein